MPDDDDRLDTPHDWQWACDQWDRGDLVRVVMPDGSSAIKAGTDLFSIQEIVNGVWFRLARADEPLP